MTFNAHQYTSKNLFKSLFNDNYNFFTGVPDSLLNQFVQDIENNTHQVQHVSAVHESQAIAIAFGAELAGKKTCVYMQNSGLGNAINPLTSLCIPCGIEPLLIIGHRHTLPQHKIMGEIDEKLLKLINYSNCILIKE